MTTQASNTPADELAGQPRWVPEDCPRCHCRTFADVDGGGVRCVHCKEVFHLPRTTPPVDGELREALMTFAFRCERGDGEPFMAVDIDDAVQSLAALASTASPPPCPDCGDLPMLGDHTLDCKARSASPTDDVLRERVAKAIEVALCRDADRNEGAIWRDERGRGQMFIAADAAIVALLQPSCALALPVKLAGAEAITADHMKKGANFDAACDCWDAMVAALSPVPTVTDTVGEG